MATRSPYFRRKPRRFLAASSKPNQPERRNTMTPIERVTEALTHDPAHSVQVLEVLVPEQCAMLMIDDEPFHVTIEKVEP